MSRLHGGEPMQKDVCAAVDHFTEKTASVADEPRLRPGLDALRAETT
ncbi:hypothetical protein [Streptomyces sp. Ru72]|nr:hypothetical protein [Streptomyces sp. Ru72]